MIFGFSVLWNARHFDPTIDMGQMVAIGFVNAYFAFAATWLSVVLLSYYRQDSIEGKTEVDNR